MKLAYHYNKASIIIAMSVLFIGGFIYYFSIRYIATDQLDHDLTEEIDEVKYYINLHNKLPQQVDFDEDQTTFTKIQNKNIPRRFFDTLYYNDKEKQFESGRAVEGTVVFKNDTYKVVISESKEATEYLVQLIVLITILLAIILLSVLIITNRLILNDLWKPFYKILNQLKTFDISDTSQLTIKQSKVDEFEELNTALLSMTTKAKSDFQHVKSFTEHASHEMMTPLAVVTSKLDTLIQDEALNADQLTQITNIYTYISKLSRLNQSLLLLVKIDNKLIKDVEPINLKETIQDKIGQFQELIQAKIILLNSHLGNKQINASKYLIDILLNNLFSNAVRHNTTGGEIDIILTGKELIIKNTGGEAPLEDNHIFERFYRGNHSEGTGMGLTLVKNICSYYNYNIKYTCQTGWHVFTITF